MQIICQQHLFKSDFKILGVFPNCACRLGKVYDHDHSVSFILELKRIFKCEISKKNENYNFRFVWILIVQSVQKEVLDPHLIASVKRAINLIIFIGTVVLGT